VQLLKDIFGFSQDSPLIFTQGYFWGFFAAVLIIYSFIHPFRAARNAFLFLVSLFFYFKTSGPFVVLLMFSTLSDYLIGFAIHYSQKKASRTFWLVMSIAINLLLLSYFKYSYFFTESFNELFGTNVQYFNHFTHWTNEVSGSHFSVDRLFVPVGISFFTFQTISYAVDVYKRKILPVKSILDFGFYVSFFPQLVAGPIVRASEFIPQIYQPYRLTKREFGIAVFWIMKGLIKKLWLADYIGVNFVDRVFDNPELFTGFENMMGLYGYSLQVYADFSGYTDIAIGIALLMGFRLPVNFNYPYKSRSVGEFWRRWHISLSTWLKDYLYIPLGGSRGSSVLTWFFYLLIPIVAISAFGVTAMPAVIFISVAVLLLFMYLDFKNPKTRVELATASNLMLTMLLGGLWHGSSWMFVIWGGLNGLGLVFYKFWRKVSPWEGKTQWYWIVWTTFFTFTFITFTRIWFRSPDMHTANLVMDQIWNNFGWEYIPSILDNYSSVFYVFYIGMVMHWLPTKVQNGIRDTFVAMPLYVQAILCVIGVFIAYQAVSSGLQPFIYFQF
jgi:D-alanyl-lipoteichoic acid acyltransferase DltB (MBOAT superfamily)